MLSKSLSFTEVNRILTEGTAEEVANLQSQLAQIETAIQQRTKPLITQKQRLTVLLAQKQKQLNMEQQREAQAQRANPPTDQQPQHPQAQQ